MTREETKTIIMTMVAAYPNFKIHAVDVTVNLWYSMFEKTPYKLVEEALKTFIKTDTKGYAPSIGQINGIIHKANSIDPLEAWELVHKAIRNGTYGAEEEFEKLPDVVKEAVGSPRRIREWARMDSDRVNTVVEGLFKKAYSEVSERAQSIGLVQKDVQALIESTSKAVSA